MAEQITDTYLIGPFHQLQHAVELAVEQWEARTGRMAESIALESHGRIAGEGVDLPH